MTTSERWFAICASFALAVALLSTAASSPPHPPAPLRCCSSNSSHSNLIAARPINYFGARADRNLLKIRLALNDLRYVHDIATKENQ